MQRYLIFSAFGWLAFSGTMHFIIDVISHIVRGKHPPGPETTLYYGLHSAFSLGQVAFAVLGFYVAWRAMYLLTALPLALSLLAGLAWLAITLLFMEYWEPKFAVGVFCALMLAALAAQLRG